MGRFDTMHHIAASRAAAIFLDRDNTIIENDGDLGDPSQVKLLQGAAAAISSLRGLGYKIVVLSNQGGVARGKYTEQDVHAVHARISELVGATTSGKIDKFYFCPYHPEGSVPQYQREHPWRKPQPGMLLQAAKDLNLDLARSWLVGDQIRDVMAGSAAGVRTILLAPDAQQAEIMRAEAAAKYGRQISPPDFIAHNLAEAARIIGQQRRPEAADDLRAQAGRARPPLAAAPEAPATPAAEPPRDKPVAPFPAVPVAAHSAPTPIEPAATPERAAEPSAELTLRQILAELRNQRDKGEEISLLYVTAIFLQAIAALCLLGALWLGHADPATFWRWIVLGIVFELGTIAALLFRRR